MREEAKIEFIAGANLIEHMATCLGNGEKIYLGDRESTRVNFAQG